MPLLSFYTNTSVEIAFWQLEKNETPAHLLSLLPPSLHYEEQIKEMNSMQRQREWLGTRCLLYLWKGGKTQIHYRADKSPYLVTDEGEWLECSITHSHDFIALGISKTEHPIGIDAEIQADRAHRLRNRYLSLHEQMNLLAMETPAVHLWCAKEAVFKLCRTEGLGFLEHIVLLRENDQLIAELPSLNQRAYVSIAYFHNVPLALASFSPISL